MALVNIAQKYDPRIVADKERIKQVSRPILCSCPLLEGKTHIHIHATYICMYAPCSLFPCILYAHTYIHTIYRNECKGIKILCTYFLCNVCTRARRQRRMQRSPSPSARQKKRPPPRSTTRSQKKRRGLRRSPPHHHTYTCYNTKRMHRIGVCMYECMLQIRYSILYWE